MKPLLVLSAAFGLALVGPGVALADDGTDSTEATTSHEQDNRNDQATTDHADPSTRTLPSHASATAKARAFGQQGAREKALHQAAKAAAADEATGEASDAKGVAMRTEHAHQHGQGAAGHNDRGQAAAAAGRANGVGHAGGHH